MSASFPDLCSESAGADVCRLPQFRHLLNFGHSSYYQGRHHIDGLRDKAADSLLHRHNLAQHPDRRLKVEDFRMSILANYQRPILRQSREGLEIENSLQKIKDGQRLIILNSKAEFHQPGVVKATYSPMFSSK